MQTLLITGANGFIGRALCREAGRHGWRVRAATRQGVAVQGADELYATGDLAASADWDGAVSGCGAVVHLAARVHDREQADREAYARDNARASEQLALVAAAAGVRRLLYVSTVKVLGEGGQAVYRDGDPARPVDVYGHSKLLAEQQLFAVAEQTGLEVVVLRPPLVYGPGVRANFLALLDWLDRRRPLPLGALHNRRSFCYLGNMVDAILHALVHPAAAGRPWLVADAQTLPLPEFISRTAAALGRPARLWPVPARLLGLAAAMTGKRSAWQRLGGSLEVDADGFARELGWQAPYSIAEGLRETAAWYRSVHNV